MNLDLTAEELAFRDRIRTFIEAALPEQIRNGAAVNVASAFEYDISHPWHEILRDAGMAAPGWPVEFGGTGWNDVEQYLWRMEHWRAGAPVISQLGMRLVAPTLLHFGTPEQKARFLPRILSGEDYWCQGFSEPGAGSDLAALSCAAVRDGDEYVVNGTKLWQTHAHFADWMILLVRTSSAGKPQQGITCLLVDMRSPGLSIKPIRTIGGDIEVNEVFLDDVRVPADQMIGAEGDGWSIAKHLLSVERASSGNAGGRLRSNMASLMRMLDRRENHVPDAFGERTLMAKIARRAIDVDIVEMLELQLLQSTLDDHAGGAGASVIKLRSSIVEQEINELSLEVVGPEVVRWNDHRPLHEVDAGQEELERLAIAPQYLNGRVRTIFGGATEVQLGIIEKALQASL
ncbi:acyl-CoA dehydrogenase [Novosphingobium indicum]|uniref:Acyl-CoA dehydrogenase n=1 Tax=Novosphingobium indicum TaxID=462949 RepID=A0ABQ2JZ58_9SPHN|nr:acyl-CoA dehydrogenase family protein [Novosphingobium indicum]GGN61745.1 acyl-CoA dehydrogenase [Novosphingobium indicum]